MKPAQLQVDNYVFKRIRLEASEGTDTGKWDVKTTVEVMRHKDEKYKWLVELTVNLKADSEKSPYVGEFGVAGLFRANEGLSEEMAGDLVDVNGPAILYAAVREMVFNLTARGPHRPVMLPSVTFIDRKKQQKAKEEQAIAEPAKV